MIQTTVKVSGMACSMCEAHINDAIRGAFPVEKVTSSHSKGETVILSEEPLDENALRTAIDATGYTAGEIHAETYKKRDCFISEKRRTELIPVARFSGHRFEINKIHIGG